MNMATKNNKTLVGGIFDFLKVLFSLVLAIVILSLGLWSFAWITGIDTISLLQQGNVAVGLAVAGLLIAIAMILGPTIASVKIE